MLPIQLDLILFTLQKLSSCLQLESVCRCWLRPIPWLPERASEHIPLPLTLQSGCLLNSSNPSNERIIHNGLKGPSGQLLHLIGDNDLCSSKCEFFTILGSLSDWPSSIANLSINEVQFHGHRLLDHSQRKILSNNYVLLKL